MSKLVFTINLSLDGCADHRVAIADDELHTYAANQLESQGAILFGRKTYQLFESYWPHAVSDPASTPADVDFARRINAIPKVVFSKTLREAAWNNTHLFAGDPVEEIQRMKRSGSRDIAVGGIQLIQTCLAHGLVDEFWLLVHPVVWGRGKRLFAGGAQRRATRLVDVSKFESGAVVLHYSF